MRRLLGRGSARLLMYVVAKATRVALASGRVSLSSGAFNNCDVTNADC